MSSAHTLTTAKYPKMLYRRLGNSGLFVSCVSLGGWVTYGGHIAEEGTLACMKQAYDLGINFFDTAECYADGQSEIMMGKAIKKFGWKRNDIVVSTKINFGSWTGDNSVNNHGVSRKHVIEGTKASLERLGLDYVDIIYAHRPDRYTPMEEIVRAFNYVIEKGWAFYWGTSMWGADEIAEACCVAQRLGLIAPVVEQPVYNVIDREVVDGSYYRVLPKFGIGLTVWSPLKQGILTGKYNDSLKEPPAGSRFAVSKEEVVVEQKKKYGDPAWVATIEKVQKLMPIAERLHCKIAHLALAWCLKNQNVTTVITGASRPEQVVDNVKCLEVLPKLTDEIMKEIDDLLGNRPSCIEPPRFGGN
ncbi:voltage-gated potassium channel beta-2 subunit [Ascosphaera apis ARSEF 7405]|uniref:Voltage-gated potassium channel beta-2 subunit n=1 Tax=Ascosphaera apis ARSEF 7405 TaxID=392613 RepID=A0A168BRL2_9EURO|nr:voltage-gated potassium channel beta-2 subunit [Ascosphaera apis ARSEF 7405]